MHIGINRKKICFLSVLMIVTLLMTALYPPPMTFPSDQNNKNKKLSIQEILSNYPVFRPNTDLKSQIPKNVSTGITLKGEISAYLPGETVHIFFWNGNDTAIILGNANPWRIEMKKNNTWESVFIPRRKPVNTVIEPGDYIHWTWDQKDNNGRKVFEGEYRVVLSIQKRNYMKDFIISKTLGKIKQDLLPLILNENSTLEDMFNVIVIFKKNITENNIEMLKQEIGEFDVYAIWKNTRVPGIAANMTKKQIFILTEFEMTKSIEYDGIATICLDSATYWTNVDDIQDPNGNYGLTGDMDGNENSYSKDDIVIAILDTGIYPSHVDLDGGKILGWVDYVNGLRYPYDDNGHGTHVASIAAGTGEGNSAYTGVAPGAALYVVKVTDAYGFTSKSLLITALDWILNVKDTYGIEIVSLSLGSFDLGDYDATAQKVDELTTAGLIVVVAAGNFGPEGNTISPPGTAHHAITVGAIADPSEGGWYLPDFSSRGPTDDGRIKPDVVAPGINIMAAKYYTSNQYWDKSGTSMSTHFVAGLAALLLEYDYTLKDDSDGDGDPDVKELLMGSAIDMGDWGKDNKYGSGRIDAEDSMNFLLVDTGSNYWKDSTLILNGEGHVLVQDEPLWVRDYVDWYKIYVPYANMIISIWISGAELDVLIALVDKYGNVITYHDPTSGNPGFIEYTTNTGGYYYIMIYWQDGCDLYNLYVAISMS